MSHSIVGIIPCLTTPFFTKKLVPRNSLPLFVTQIYFRTPSFTMPSFAHNFSAHHLANPDSCTGCHFACWRGTHGTMWRAWASLVKRDTLVFGAVTVAFIGSTHQACHCNGHTLSACFRMKPFLFLANPARNKCSELFTLILDLRCTESRNSGVT